MEHCCVENRMSLEDNSLNNNNKQLIQADRANGEEENNVYLTSRSIATIRMINDYSWFVINTSVDYLSFIPRWTYCRRFANCERTKNIQKFFLLEHDWEITSESLWFLGQLLPAFRLLFSLCFSPFVQSSLPKLGSSHLNEFDYNKYSNARTIYTHDILPIFIPHEWHGSSPNSALASRRVRCLCFVERCSTI